MRSHHWLPGVKVGSQSGGLGKACQVLHRSWEQSSPLELLFTWPRIELSLKTWFHKRGKLKFDTEGEKNTAQPCLGRIAEVDSTCVYEHREWWLTHVWRGQKCVYFSLQSSLCIFEVWEFVNSSREGEEERRGRRGGGQKRRRGGERRGKLFIVSYFEDYCI